jgi:biopolymer transport protein ExbD
MSAKRVVDEMQSGEIKLELTPMIDMAFLIIIFFMCLPFKTLDGKLAAFLPTDKGINPVPQEPPPEIKVSVHIVARKEVQGTWNNKAVMKPTEFKYRFNDRETDSLDDVGGWIAEAKKRAATSDSIKVVGEIKAGHKVPHKYIVAVLNKFAEAEMSKVDFFGTQVPNEELRKFGTQRAPLPYPTANYGVSDG